MLSWVDERHRGYPYPEAAGLLLRWLANDDDPRLHPVQDALLDAVQQDGVGRDGLGYTFDTAVVLAGLEARGADESICDAARLRLATELEARTVVRRRGEVDTPVPEPRWSTEPGPHLLKLAVGSLARAHRARTTPCVAALARWPYACDAQGRLRTPPHVATYMHAHAYGVEGLFALAELDVEGSHIARAHAHQAVEFMARTQRDDGGIAAWHDGENDIGPSRTDATAQAVRLFILADPDRYASSIARGLDFLDRLTDPGGALRYDTDSRDLNTWATLFALQARAWAHGAEPHPRELL